MNLTPTDYISAVFYGDLREEWDRVFRAINDESRPGHDELTAYNEARLRLFQERVPIGTFDPMPMEEWPHSAEFQLRLWHDFNIPPSVAWIDHVNAEGDTLSFLTPAQELSDNPFWFCCMVPDASYF